jgi:putative hemolysin
MIELAVIAACLLLNGILAGVEMAFVTIGRPRLRELARSGNRDAQSILKLRENPERTLSILQIGITLVGAIAAAVGGAGAEELLDPILMQRFAVTEETAEIIGIILVVLPITYLSVVVGELVPKALALRNPQKISSENRPSGRSLARPV